MLDLGTAPAAFSELRLELETIFRLVFRTLLPNVEHLFTRGLRGGTTRTPKPGSVTRRPQSELTWQQARPGVRAYAQLGQVSRRSRIHHNKLLGALWRPKRVKEASISGGFWCYGLFP